ncbi:MAG: peptidoglycan DD-metalloendopeptidase family protein [Cyanobacteria bacterium J06614_10]
MTAPQHQANAESNAADMNAADMNATKANATDASMTAQQEGSPSSSSANFASRGQKLQRFWFMALGLSGGFGFVASQMSLAIAQTDLLINAPVSTGNQTVGQSAELPGADYLSAQLPVNHAAPEVGTVAAQPTFAVPAASQPAPVPETFIEAPVSAAAFVPAPEPVAPQPIAAQPTPVTPAYAAPLQTEAPAVAVPEAAPTAAPAVEPLVQPNTAVTISVPTASEAAASETASIEIEITPAENAPAVAHSEFNIKPTVTSPRPPAFTTAQKPTAQKVIHRGHPLVGLIEANMVAAPLSAYAIDRGENRPGSAILVAANDLGTDAGVDIGVGAAESAPAEPAPAVPDIMPEPVEAAPPVAAPPIVDIAPVAEEATPVQPTEIVPAALPEGTSLPEEYNSIFVDPTDYSVGATEAPDVVVAEEATGCEFTVGQGQAVPDGACGAAPQAAPTPVANGPAANPSGTSAPSAASAAAQPAPAPAAPVAAPVASAPAVNVGPVSFSATGIRLSTSAAGRDYLNRSVRPLVNLQAAESFIFPLSIPSPITSLFGFRIHPITGDRRFHAGTDIGAAQGTPVLAAQDGTVASASSAGGYGLMVVLRHETEDVQLESRYAHLAEIFVEAGKEVKKGDIIGLVGSTGNSTGPHLHFEMRQLTADGWMLVNADGLVQASLANLIKALNSPMQVANFNLSDFNLSNLRAGSLDVKSGDSAGSKLEGTQLIPGQDGIPFRPAQPNAS